MRILGIDPGIGRVGWAFIDDNGKERVMIEFGCFETEVNSDKGERLVKIYEFFSKLIEIHKPETVAIEQLFFTRNIKTAMAVGQATGVMLLVVGQAKLPVTMVGPMQVKLAVAGSGRAEKKEVKSKITELFKLDKNPRLDDAADALAVALTFALNRG